MYIYFMDEYIMFISKEKNDLEYPSFEVSETIAQRLVNKPHKIIKVPDVEVTEDNFNSYFEEFPTEVPIPQEVLTQQVAGLMIENKKKDMAIESLVKMVADLNIKVQGGIN